MWCVVLKYKDKIGYEVLDERFERYDDAFEFGKKKEQETGLKFGVDVAPNYCYEHDSDSLVEMVEMKYSTMPMAGLATYLTNNIF